jgi:hypothetical protein
VQGNIIVTNYRSDLMSSTSCFMEGGFIYANSLFLLGMPDGDAMEDIVDELGEDEITEESCKLFFFLQYLGKE